MITRSRRSRITGTGTHVKNPDTINVLDLIHVHWESPYGFHQTRFVVAEVSRIGNNQQFYAQHKGRGQEHKRLILTHSHRGFLVDGCEAIVTNYGTTINQSPTLPGMEL